MSRELQGAEPGSAASANILKVIVLLRRAGWWGFTIQVILTVIAAVILAQAFFTITIVESGKGNPGLGPGLSLASIGLLLACANVFWMYWYTRLAKKLGAVNGDRRDRPSKASTLNQVKIGVYISLLGIALALLGEFSIVGVLFSKAISTPRNTVVTPGSFSSIVQPLDIFIVQANTNVILAHFIGLLISLWLLVRIPSITERSNN
jgi:hypothetical protein